MEKTKIAICYDFDHTLTPFDMQEQGFLQTCCNYSKDNFKDFWDRVNKIKEEQNMDQTTAYMYQMIIAAKEAGGFIRESKLKELGKKIKFFDGVKEWFGKINKLGKGCDCEVEHYVISNGNYEIIEGTSIFNQFKKVYASTFHYDKDGNADWPGMVINYTNKTQFLFRIKKQVLEVYNEDVNSHFSDEEIPIPFSNMIYIGDSDTDIPCMQIIKNNCGFSICVYEENDEHRKQRAQEMFKDNRVNFYTTADYSDDKELFSIVKDIISNISISNKLKSLYYEQKNKLEKQRKEIDYKTETWDKVNRLSQSASFDKTHKFVKEFTDSEIDSLIQEQCCILVDAAKNNFQISYLIGDEDVKGFYTKVKDRCHKLGIAQYAEKINRILNK